VAATDQKIEVGNLVGYLVHPNLEPERVVMRVTALPSDSVRGKRAKGEILACSGSDKSQIGKTGHFFLQDIELILIESDIDSWVQLEIPSYAYDITGKLTDIRPDITQLKEVSVAADHLPILENMTSNVELKGKLSDD